MMYAKGTLVHMYVHKHTIKSITLHVCILGTMYMETTDVKFRFYCMYLHVRICISMQCLDVLLVHV